MATDPNGSFILQIKGLDSLVSGLRSISDEFDPYLQFAMYNACIIIANDAKEIHAGSFKNQTGNLRRSIQVQGVTATRGVVFTDQDYAAYVEQGTEPHTITAVNKKVLADQKNNIIFGRIVNHPGSRAYPFMEPAMRNNADKILEQYADLFQEMANRNIPVGGDS